MYIILVSFFIIYAAKLLRISQTAQGNSQ